MWCGVGKLVFPVGYLRSTVWGRQACAPCRISSLQHILCPMSVKVHGHHKTVTELSDIWPPSDFWDIAGIRTAVSACVIGG